ncbi:hypothetical protein [Pasteuria penetrans]|uniref:hypothetical protein n=1 Tax=Pasteuria penetrans TaxID=86005 RepID=UPI000FA6A86A|nr:hypothetical protein [Pasteuria penetrans]
MWGVEFRGETAYHGAGGLGVRCLVWWDGVPPIEVLVNSVMYSALFGYQHGGLEAAVSVCRGAYRDRAMDCRWGMGLTVLPNPLRGVLCRCTDRLPL